MSFLIPHKLVRKIIWIKSQGLLGFTLNGCNSSDISITNQRNKNSRPFKPSVWNVHDNISLKNDSRVLPWKLQIGLSETECCKIKRKWRQPYQLYSAFSQRNFRFKRKINFQYQHSNSHQVSKFYFARIISC